jgi:hypothetical protein
MNVEFKWVKDIPKQKINMFEDRVVYYAAIYTRERVKGTDAYPYLSGELSRQELAQPIVGSDKQYSWLSGVDYAVYVWNMKSPHWTNPKTKPQWYYTQFKQDKEKILSQAQTIALKEI